MACPGFRIHVSLAYQRAICLSFDRLWMTYRVYVGLSCLLKNDMSILRLALDGMSGLSDTCRLSLSKSYMSTLRHADVDLSDLCQAELLVEERYVYPSTGSGWHVRAFGYMSAQLIKERYVYSSTGSGWHVLAFGYMSAQRRVGERYAYSLTASGRPI